MHRSLRMGAERMAAAKACLDTAREGSLTLPGIMGKRPRPSYAAASLANLPGGQPSRLRNAVLKALADS